jgi:hypothetical protein
MLFEKMIAVFHYNNTKHINKLCGKDAEILVLKIPSGMYSVPLFFFYHGATAPSGAKASPLSTIHDHTQTHHAR